MTTQWQQYYKRLVDSESKHVLQLTNATMSN